MRVERKCEIVRKHRDGETIFMVLHVGDMVRASQMRPGQFLHIKCGEGLLLRRPISISRWTGSETGDTLTIVFEIRGEGTAWLAERQEGEFLDVLGPLGNGFNVEDAPYLLVGGGIGVPPIQGCAEAAQGKSTAILGFRSKDRVILLGHFDRLCAKVLVATDDGSLGYHGFVDALVRQELEKEHHYQGVLACGPKPMLKSVAKVAAEFGVPCQVSMEERMGCGVGACLVCATPMKDGTVRHVCKDGPVFNAEEVDWDA